MNISKVRYLNLAELITWVWEQGIDDARYYSNNGSYVDFEDSEVVRAYQVDQIDTFRIEDSTEITTSTVIPYFLTKDNYYNYREYRNKTIDSLLFLDSTMQIWFIHEDYTHTLIWKYGKLVD